MSGNHDGVRTFGEIRLVIFKIGPFALHTKSIVVAEWPEWAARQWTILAIDPNDEVAHVYWQEQGTPALRTLT